MFAPDVSSLLTGEHIGGYRGSRSSLSVDPVLAVKMKNKESDDADSDDNHNDDSTENFEENIKRLKLDFARMNQRRATDFSQADNDLRHFLATRQNKTSGDSIRSIAENNETPYLSVEANRQG